MKGLPLTSSVVVARALGAAPDGVRATAAGVCACCGLAIAVGDMAAPFAVSQSFVDDLSLAARGSPVMCGYCAALMTVEYLRQSGYGAFGADGAHPFRKWADIAAAMLEPPEPPFVMVYATANNQHMAWRAPVNLSREQYYVRVGLRDLRVRRSRLREAVEACRVVGEKLASLRGSKPSQKTLPHPYRALSSDLKDPMHGAFAWMTQSSVYRESESPQERAALEMLRGLSLGETWGLRFVLSRAVEDETHQGEKE